MSRILSLLKVKSLVAIVKVFLGDATSQGLNFLTVIILARIYGPNQISLYTVAVAFLTLLLSIADSGIGNSVVSLVNRKISPQEKRYFLVSGFYMRIVFGLVLLIFGLFFSSIISNSLYKNGGLDTLFFYAFIGVVILSVHGYIITINQANEKFLKRSLIQVLTSIVRFSSIMILFLTNRPSIELAFIFYIFTPIIVLMFFYKDVIHLVKIKVNMKLLLNYSSKIVSYSKWLFFSMIAVLLTQRADQFMLLKYSSPKETSFYTMALQISTVLPLVTNSMTTVLLPKVSSLESSLRSYRKNILKVMLPFSLLFLLLIFIAKFIIFIVLGEQYLPAVPIFQVLIIGFCLEIVINPLSLIFYSSSKVWHLTFLNYWQLGLVVVLNVMFIPKYGAMGATVGIVCVRLLALFYVLYFTKKMIEQKEIGLVDKANNNLTY